MAEEKQIADVIAALDRAYAAQDRLHNTEYWGLVAMLSVFTILIIVKIVVWMKLRALEAPYTKSRHLPNRRR